MSIRGQVARGAVWVILTRMGDRAVGFVSTLILARLLVPADFGVLALAMSVVALVDLIRRFGFELVLIQNQAATREHFDTVWTLNLAFSLGVAVLLALAATPAAAFYEEPRLAHLMLLIALRPMVEGLQNIGVVHFQKELRFHQEFRYIMGARLAGFTVTVTMAFLLRNYWALAVGLVSAQTIQTALSYVVHPYRPRLSLAAVRETLGFSSWIAASNAVQFVIMKSPDFVIGKILGAHTLGLFNISYEVGYLTASELSTPINRAVFPAYAMKGTDLGALRRGMLEVVSSVAVVVLPVGLGLASVAELAVPVMLGEKWRAAIPLVSMLAVYGTLKAMASNTAYIFLTLRRPAILLMLGIAESLILVPALVKGVMDHGVLGATWAYLLAVSIVAPVAYGIVLWLLELSPLRLLSSVWRPVVSGGLMVLAVRSLLRSLAASETGVALADELILCSAVGAVVYAVCLLGLWWLSGKPEGAEQRVFSAAAGVWRSLRGDTDG